MSTPFSLPLSTNSIGDNDTMFSRSMALFATLGVHATNLRDADMHDAQSIGVNPQRARLERVDLRNGSFTDAATLDELRRYTHNQLTGAIVSQVRISKLSMLSETLSRLDRNFCGGTHHDQHDHLARTDTRDRRNARRSNRIDRVSCVIGACNAHRRTDGPTRFARPRRQRGAFRRFLTRLLFVALAALAGAFSLPHARAEAAAQLTSSMLRVPVLPIAPELNGDEWL
jgi:hypothetical protein